MSLSAPLRGSLYSAFWRPRIPAPLSSVKNVGIIQVIQWVQPRGAEFRKQQLITNSECCTLFQCNASRVLGMEKFMGVSMWSTTTHWSEWASAILGRCSYSKFTLQCSDLHFYTCTLHVFLRHSLAGVACSLFPMTLSSRYLSPLGSSVEEVWWPRNKTTCPASTWEHI